jgi:hypothetical protein
MSNNVQRKTNYEIPSILVPSTREVLQFFNEQIVELEAGGSTQTENVISPPKEFGYEEKEIVSPIVSIDYQKEWKNSSTPKNEIDNSKANKLSRDIHTRLQKHNHNGNWKFDCPVSRLVVEVECDDLKEHFGTRTNSFMLEFTSMPSGGKAKDETQNLYDQRGLGEQGFELRNLVLRSITDEYKYFRPDEEPNISWDGFEDVNMPFESTMSSDIYKNHLPQSISQILTLKETSEQRLVMG